MLLQLRNHFQELPRRWQILFVSTLSCIACFALWVHAEARLLNNQYGCQPPLLSSLGFRSPDKLNHENYHTLMSAQGSKILLLQHCVYPSKRMMFPLRNHLDYAKRHGYAYAARTGLIDPKRNKNRSLYWEKVHLTQQVMEEQWLLPESERVEWIVWADADTLILNPTIDMQAFLPPKDDQKTWFVISRDHWGSNFGVFCIKPTQEAWDFLWEILWTGETLPSWVLPMKEQSAMQMLLPRQGVTIIPKEWMNSWGLKNPLEVLEKDPYSSGSPTCLQAHFSGRHDKAVMGKYVEYFADPRFGQSWEEGKRHWEGEAKLFWDRQTASL